MSDTCQVKHCKREAALSYYGINVCTNHWEKHCDENSSFDLKKVLGIKKVRSVVMANETAGSTCPVFGEKWDPNAKECKECKKDYPSEYHQCMRLTKVLINAKENTERKRKMSDEKSKTEVTEEAPVVEEKAATEVTGEPPKEEPEKEAVKETVKMPNMKKLCRTLIKEGKSKDEVINQMASEYVEKKGKDERYARSRSRTIYTVISKEGAGEEAKE